jgi:hypothetical protein
MSSDGERVTRAAADPLNLRIHVSRIVVRKNLFHRWYTKKWNKIPAAVKKQAKAF